MVDKFTKWIEAKPITNNRSEEAVKFFLDIIYRFGVPNWFTPFFLAYGAEAVLPSNIDHGAPRVKAFDRDRATEAQQDVVDLLKEARETTVIRFARYQQTLRRYHERKITGRILKSNCSMQRTGSSS
ncbi:uncharacterized protein [Miscanthus floridulus]|uniref:uncharacterized protein n=1 Tax=Miscanthus floridulus TaxID=154761 RepID=UPI003459DB96